MCNIFVVHIFVGLQLDVRALVSFLTEMPAYCGPSLLSVCGQVLLATGGEAVNADKELLFFNDF